MMMMMLMDDDDEEDEDGLGEGWCLGRLLGYRPSLKLGVMDDVYDECLQEKMICIMNLYKKQSTEMTKCPRITVGFE